MIQQFIGPIVVLCFMVFALFAITSNNWTLLGIGALVPYLIMLISRPNWLMIGGIVTMFSQLTIPGFGVLANFHMYHIMFLGFGMITMARLIISKEATPKAVSRWFLYLFMVVLVVTMHQRGFGLRILGDSKVGGGAYVQILAMMLFYFGSRVGRLSDRQWRFAFVGMLSLTALPLGASLLWILSRGTIYQQYYFVTADMGVIESYETYKAGGFTRWSGFGGFSYLYLIPFLFYPFRGHYRFYYFFFTGVALFFAALTGFRSVLLVPMLFVGAHAFIKSKNKVVFLAGTALATTIFLFLLSFVSKDLPYPIQRVLTIVPFMPVEPVIRDIASGTIDWRFMLWRRWLSEVPQYLLLGRGIAYDQSAYLSVTRYIFSVYDEIEGSVILGDYHLGFFSGLILVGIPGMLAMLGFWISDILRHIRIQRMPWSNPRLQQYHFTFLLLTTISVVYQLAAGAFVMLVINSLVYLGLMNAMANSRTQPADAPPSSRRPAFRKPLPIR